MTPTIEEMRELFIAVSREQGYTGSPNVTAGLTAVIKTHIVPMVEAAFVAGSRDGQALIACHERNYSTRIEREIMGAGDE